MRVRGFAITIFAVCSLIGVLPGNAGADAPGPGWVITGGASHPTNMAPGGTGIIGLDVYDVGAIEAKNGTLTVSFPQGLETDPVRDDGHGADDCEGTGRLVTCKLTLQPASSEFGSQALGFPVQVTSGAVEGQVLVQASVKGGGVRTPASVTFPVTISSKPAEAGLSGFGSWFSNADGTLDTQAGSHPYAYTTVFTINNFVRPKFGEEIPPVDGGLRNIVVNLPPGVVGNPNAVPQCTRPQFDNEYAEPGEEGGGCPSASQIGWVAISIANGGINDAADLPVYNLVPPPGEPAQFGFTIASIGTFLDSKVRTGGNNGISVRVNNITEQDEPVRSSLTLWGDPGSPIYNAYRHGCQQPSGCSTPGAKPLMTLPTSCGAPPEFTAEIMGMWDDENAFSKASAVMHDAEGNPVGFTGCNKLVQFEPTVSIAPDTSHADTPAGLTTKVLVTPEANTEGLATSGLKDTTVVLPEGMAINPGQATGLQACQAGVGPGDDSLPREGETGGESEAFEGPPACPSASKVGEDEISTPLLANKLHGSVYVLQSNPPNIKLLVAASGEGVNLKLVGTVHLNPVTGQLTAIFENTPDAPLTEFKLSFSGGGQAALVTPPTCRVYTASADFSPWSGPFVKDALQESLFQITSGPEGTPCENPLPFEPVMTAGATTDQAGGYTDFSMLLQRGDGQQRVSSLSFKTPEGLLGMIAKVPLCQEPQAAQGTCSAASQIGHTIVGAGPGPYPFYIPQTNAPPAPIYLTGPYKGAPFGLSIVVPLIAGPFNLGTEVVRARIEVDRHTTQITVITDPLPLIVKGIPTDLRSINAVIDRSEFMFNPTDCNPMSFSGTATSAEGAIAPLSSHFQMGSCQALKFQPNFKVSTSGKTSRTNGASLTAKIVYPTGNLGFNQASSQSNINSVKVDLPKQLPSRLTTLQKACTAATFAANPANCPPASIVGHAKAITPILPVPLEGPAYFVSHAGEEFPSLIVVLQGYGVTDELVGATFINNKTNITSSTFKQVPDVPISLFELTLPQGKYSALAANGNLCKTKLTMPTAFIAQNGATLKQSTSISVTGCAKSKKTKKVKSKGKETGKGHQGKKK
jgi:hypothetical protein